MWGFHALKGQIGTLKYGLSILFSIYLDRHLNNYTLDYKHIYIYAYIYVLAHANIHIQIYRYCVTYIYIFFFYILHMTHHKHLCFHIVVKLLVCMVSQMSTFPSSGIHAIWVDPKLWWTDGRDELLQEKLPDQHHHGSKQRSSARKTVWSTLMAAVNQRIPLPNVSKGFCRRRPGLISGKPMVFRSPYYGQLFLGEGGWVRGCVPQNARNHKFRFRNYYVGLPRWNEMCFNAIFFHFSIIF